eukprot:Seg1385.4 transcript_id=Seg1385.4/GoldUCD/mRNA.D3Y31 product="Phosphatidylinositol N-acetylglucosaminyltransferase subunit Q" protein_id=Seg1385.4/GoldUCD/D3Y31
MQDHKRRLMKFAAFMPCSFTQLKEKLEMFSMPENCAEVYSDEDLRKEHSGSLFLSTHGRPIIIQKSSAEQKQGQKLTKYQLRNSRAASMLFDVFIGIIISFLLNEFLPADKIASYFILWRNRTELFLNELLEWLMGAPAGLKLNYEMTIFLGKFFLYHIYIWIGYLAIMEPFYQMIIQALIYSSCLGFSIMLALASDLLAFLTFHTYCFYVYAAKVYSLQLQGLISLSRLFRGMKWNPLRNRVDSISYDADQLAFGTILFTVLLFLLPTTMVYYLVFASLRLPILLVKTVLHCLVMVINTFPVYDVLKRLLYQQGEIDFMTFTISYGPGTPKILHDKGTRYLNIIKIDDQVKLISKTHVVSMVTLIKQRTVAGLLNFTSLKDLVKPFVTGNVVNSLTK